MKNILCIFFFLLTLLFVKSCKENVDEKVIEKEKLENIAYTTVSNSAENQTEINHKEEFDLPFEIEGEYRFVDEVANCEMHLSLFYVKGILKYELKTNERNVNGDAEISKEDNEQFYITFKDIEWSENKGLIDPEGITPEDKLPLPTEIMAGLRDNQIIFQNYGNAENYFVILKECDTKFIFFEKV